MKRFLAVAGALVLALTVAACGTGSTASQVATDAQLLANGLAAIEPFLPAADTALLTKVEAAVAIVAKDAKALAANPKASVAAEIETAINDVLPLVASAFPPGSTGSVVVAAVTALLPEFEQLAGLPVPNVAAADVMSVESAKGFLGGLPRA